MDKQITSPKKSPLKKPKHNNGPESKPNLPTNKTRQPNSPKPPNDIGKPKLKYKMYDELN